MKSLNIQIKLLSPVILSSHVPDNNLTGTLGHIPASSILGLFAAKYIHDKKLKNAHDDNNFFKWFLKNHIIFTNTYISEKMETDEIDFQPTPMCIKKQKKDNQLVNILAVDDDYDEQTTSFSPFSNICGNTIKAAEPEKIINFHHKRDRLSGHTKDRGMFNYEALVPGQVFKGKIYGDTQDLQAFKRVFGDEFTARLGKSRNTEYGKVKITLSEIIKEDANLTDLHIEVGEPVFLTFITPCILYNKFGFSDSSAVNLKRYLEDIWEKDTFEINNCVARTSTTENYISVWKMKRPLETTIVAGSTYKLNFNEKLTIEDIKSGFEKILKEGIGERRGEGFGRVKINMATLKNYGQSVIKDKNMALEKPKSPIPEEAKKIFKRVVKNFLKTEFEHEAYKKASNFKKLPSNALLGKLALIAANTKKPEFVQSIRKLRKTAKDQLKNCENKNSTLYDYIEKFESKSVIKNIYSDIIYASYEELEKCIDYNTQADENFNEILWSIYLQSLFRTMRLINQQAAQEGGTSR